MYLKNMILEDRVGRMEEDELLDIIRKAVLSPSVLGEIVYHMESQMNAEERFPYHLLAPISPRSIAISTAGSVEWNENQIIVYSEVLWGKTVWKVFGDCEGLECLLILDIAMDGDSIVSAAKAIRDADGICTKAFVFVDWEKGARTACEENGIKMYSCLKKSDFEIEGEK